MHHGSAALKQPDMNPERLLAEITVAYLECLAGLRRPDQLGRWLSPAAYQDLLHRCQRETRMRQLGGLQRRPEIGFQSCSTFATESDRIQAVVIVQISGRFRSMSIRAEFFNQRIRVLDLILI